MPEGQPELFEALDRQAKPTGELKTRSQILDDGDWRKVTHVWAFNAHNQLVVQERAQKGLWDGLWDVSVGGGVSAVEDPLHAAKRELQEELGIDVLEIELHNLGRWETTKPLLERQLEAREFSYSYFLNKEVELGQLKTEPREIASVALVSLDELKSKIEDPSEYKKWVPHPRSYYLGVIALIKAQNR